MTLNYTSPAARTRLGSRLGFRSALRAALVFWPPRVLVALTAAALLTGASVAGFSVARAQGATVTAEQKQEMKLHYERAQRAFDIAKYSDAIDEYAKVYEIGGNASMLFNIAQAHRLNNQLPEALRFYRRYLQRAPNAPNRADVEQKIADLEKALEKGGGADDRGRAAGPGMTPTSPVQPSASPATAASPPGPVTSPSPSVMPASPSQSSSSSSFTEPPPVNTSPPVEPAPVAAAGGSNARLWGVVSLLAVGAGGLVLASFEALNASSKADALTAQSKQGKVFDPGLETSGRRANAIAITSAIVGSVALAAGAVLFFTGPRSPALESTSPRVSVAPWVSPAGVVGAGASWAY